MALSVFCDSGLYYRLFFFCYICSSVFSAEKTDARSQFYTHAVVYPVVMGNDSTGKQHEFAGNTIPHDEKLIIAFTAFNKTFILDLEMNKNLLPPHYFEKHHEGGKHKISKPMEKVVNHCQYQGHVQDIKNSWAAISTCSGISGVIYDGEELHYIQPEDHMYSSNKNNVNSVSHLFFKSSDMKPHNFTCGFHGQLNPANSRLSKLRRHRRSVVLQEPYKTDSHSRFLELVLVNDNREFKKFNESKRVVFERSKQIANIVNGLYAPLNIFIALVGVIIWSEHDEIKLSTDGDVTLTNFLHYRRERLSLEHPNDNAQLITAITFDGGVVGKALKGPVCTFQYSGGVNGDHSDIVGFVATTIAHEIGHNFGIEHDTDECLCPDAKCIMAPSSSSTSPKHWSSCSLDYLAIAYSQGMDYCLKNQPKQVVGPVCGNGFLEKGEECDCGLKEFCDNPCCNASVCKLHLNASCATGACCDIKSCEVKKVATVCRKAISECDLPEYCDGSSEWCPPDTNKQNGISCEEGQAYCYDGKCSSHAHQCKILWGKTGKMSDVRCYEQNWKGNVNGNCGYNRLNKTYKACNKRDILCGMLHCTHLNERLEFGMESAAILARSFINVKGKIFTCRSAIVDLGLYNIDPGLTPNGAKCAEEKMCINQKCVSVDIVKGKKCPLDCSGNGICNSNGHCHCHKGYAPPYCNTPGSGGSVDSGPVSDPGVGHIVIVAMYVIFLGLVPLVIFSSCAIYHFRPHFKTWWITKARKASIKCRAKQTIQKKPPQLPSKFNFDRNSIRTLEISAPIQPNLQTVLGSNAPSLIPRETILNEKNSSGNEENSGKVLGISNQQKIVPVRPAPPRPNSAHVNGPQRSPSWTPATAIVLPNVVRTASLRVSSEGNVKAVCGRPLSMSASRPSCPPPRPPPPKSSSPLVPKLHKPTTAQITQKFSASCGTEQFSTPSVYYDDCQTLDFSSTLLSFHQNEINAANEVGKSAVESSQCSTKSTEASVQSINTQDQNKNSRNKVSQSVLKSSFQRPGRSGQASVVQSLAKKFENQKYVPHSTINASHIKPPFKSRPLPPPPKDSEV